MTQKSIVLGLAAGYHYNDLTPFCRSLHHVAKIGTQSVLFTSPTTRGADRLSEFGIRTIPFERPEAMQDIPYNGYRYRLYRDLLRSSSERYHRILITDVRDVFFQSDPFAYPWPEGLNATLEDASMTIGTCPHNSRWMRRHLGDDTLHALAHERISCSGTTVADHDTMLEYLDAMIDHMDGFVPAQNMAGFDQAIHNMLIRKDFHSKCVFHDNGGPIMTLGYHPAEPHRDDNENVLNTAGSPAVIVHQYDRKPGLFKIVRERFAG